MPLARPLVTIVFFRAAPKMNHKRSNIFEAKKRISISIGHFLWILIIATLFLGPLPAIAESNSSTAPETEDVVEDSFGGINSEGLRRKHRQRHTRLLPKPNSGVQILRLEIKSPRLRSVDGHRLRNDLLAPLRC